MGSAQSASGRSRRAQTTPSGAERRVPFVSYKRVLQAGSVAAALGSILALVLTVGTQFSGLFGSDGTPRVHIKSVKLEPMPLGSYVMTYDPPGPGEPTGYTKKELDGKVLAVSIDMQYENATRGGHFRGILTLDERTRPGGRLLPPFSLRHDYALNAGRDSCVCHDFFFLSRPGSEYRVKVQILRPNLPHAQPFAEYTTEWSGLK